MNNYETVFIVTPVLSDAFSSDSDIFNFNLY